MLLTQAHFMHVLVTKKAPTLNVAMAKLCWARLMLLLYITACLVADSEAIGISIGQYRHHGYGLKSRRPLRKVSATVEHIAPHTLDSPS